MSALLQDLRYGLRRLQQSPGFALVCVITLALGIGANTAIFTLVDAVMLKSLPVENPKELYQDNGNCCVLGGLQEECSIFSYNLYKDFRDHEPGFSQMAAFQGGEEALNVRRGSASGPAEPFGGEFVSGNYFSTLGLSAFAGRVITPDDDKADAPAVAVMSYRAWQQNFGLDPSVIGRTLHIDQMPYTVVGIAPPGFSGDQLRADPPALWLPLSTEVAHDGQNSILNDPGMHWLYIMGRLKPGANPASVQSEATAQLQQWLATQAKLTARDRARLGKQHIVVAPAGGGVENVQQDARAGLRLLMAIAGLALLIACANIANLLLARGAAT